MTREGRREALLVRFRAAALERLGGMLGMLEILERLAGPPDLEALRADLHTLKGETRMLGLRSLASLAHAIEDWLETAALTEPESRARLRAVLELFAERIAAPLVEDSAAEQALARGHSVLLGVVEPMPTELRAGEARPPSPSKPDSKLARVDATTLDLLCDRLEQLRAAFGNVGARAHERGERSVALTELDDLRRELGELTELAWTLRMLAVEPELRELATHAERQAGQLGKRVRVDVDAGGAELERSLLERLHEPMLHLVNNAIDHGIESPGERGSKPELAQVAIVARSLGRELEIEIRDDGRGIDRERVRARAIERGLIDAAAAPGLADLDVLELLFAPGFSTALRVGELSGRGVGLGVVRRVVESLGGNVVVASELGRGTRFTLRVPATISRERVVVVELGTGLWGLPARRVGPILTLREHVDQHAQGTTIRVDGEHVPLLSLAGLIGLSEPVDEAIAICCTRGERRYALASPEVLGELELFRLPLGPTLASIGPASASAVTDDGRMVLLLEPTALLDARRRGQARFAAPQRERARPRVLVVDDSAIVRELLVELLVAGGLAVEQAEDGQAALDRLAHERFDLVVSDVEMPRVDGFELLAAIRERLGHLPVIMASTRASVADRQRAVELGADAYIVKSEFTEQSLLDSVARFVEVVR
ncbi:hybrid sensor histidine kinase/response regulator [Nannocystaceae bacterium ST9]